MGASVPLPRELLEFLQLTGPQSLLIRGPPGSGKTTLSLGLLEAFSGARFFLTNRVPGDDVLRSFPWLGGNGTHRIEVVDNSSTGGSLTGSARALMRQSIATLEEDAPDARELREFLWLPEPLQETWSRLDPSRQSLVIIDSWDALVESYIGSAGARGADALPDRQEIERLLLRRMARAHANLVFVLEREEQTQLDYLVNGVVVTNREVVQDRLERWLTILKLRGVRIENASYPFSLESARFECILPVRQPTELEGGRYDPAPDRLPGQLWPGSNSFAEIFGRLPLGRATLIETDRDVPLRVPFIMISPMVAQVVDSGGHVLFVTDPGTLPEDVWAMFHGAVPKDRFEKQVRFLFPPLQASEPTSEMEHVVVRLKRTPPTSGDSERGLGDFLRSGSTPDAPGLLVVSVHGLVSIAGAMGMPITSDTAERLPGQMLAAVRGQPLHALVLGNTHSPLVEPMRSVATMRIHMRARQGRIFLYGADPWTPTLLLRGGHESSPYGLLRVV